MSSSAETSRLWSKIYWLVLAGFILRLALMFLFTTYRFNQIDDWCNVGETSRIASSIARGHGFSSPFGEEYTGPSAWIAPAYPYFVAFLYRMFGIMTPAASLSLFTVQALFSAFTVIPIFGIALRTIGKQAGFVAAWSWALFPWFGKWSVTWVWEISLSALLFALLLWCTLLVTEKNDRKLWIAFGALWGFGLLVNPAMCTLLPVSLAWCAVKLRGRSARWIALPALAAMSCVIAISPWLIRNRVVFGQWVFLRSNFPFEFAIGNYHLSFGRGWGGKHPSGNATDYANYIHMGEVAYVHMKAQGGLQFVRDYPWEFATLTAKRAQYFWDGSAMDYRWPIPWYWMPWSFALFSFLVLPGCLAVHRRAVNGWQLMFAALLLYPLPYYLTFSQVRYRHAVEPVMVLVIAFAATESYSWLKARWREPIRLRAGFGQAMSGWR